MRLEDKVAIVTGANRGFGLALVHELLARGASKVYAGVRDPAAIKLPGVVAVKLDVTKRESIDAMVKRVVDTAGAIDILVNNAAIFDMGPFLEIGEASYDSQFAVNVKGLLFTGQAVAAAMVRRGGGGKIVNFASQAGRRGEALVAVYCATKAAVISLTQSMALELIKHRINVNAIAPGVVDTPMWDQVDALFAKYENRPIGEKKRLVGEAVPFGRMGVPEDIVGAAVFLASADSNYILGQTLNVDGGNWMS